MNSSFDARIEAQLRRAGRSLEELKQQDPLFDANAMSAFAAKFKLVLDTLESVNNERDSLVQIIRDSGDKCGICKHNRQIKDCVPADFMCICCHQDCVCKDCEKQDNFEYEAQAGTATGCEKEKPQ